MNVEDLLTGNACMGGSGVSIVYCCSSEKGCEIRNKLLQKLGITPAQFSEIKERHRIDANVCFGNLAYCCSLEKECSQRDRALEELGMSREDYIQYKKKIAEDFYRIAGEKLFTEKALYTYIANMLNIETKEELRCVLLGDGETFRALFLEPLGELKIENGAIICVYLKEETFKTLYRLSKENGHSISKTVSEIVEQHVAPASKTLARSTKSLNTIKH